MSLILNAQGEPAIKKAPKSEVWMDYNAYLFDTCWMHCREIEWWETKGRGYKATGIVSENSKWLDRVKSGEITGDNIKDNLPSDMQRSTTPEFKDKR